MQTEHKYFFSFCVLYVCAMDIQVAHLIWCSLREIGKRCCVDPIFTWVNEKTRATEHTHENGEENVGWKKE